MDETERKALASLRLNWAPTPDDVWRSSPYHVDGLHRDTMDLIMAGFEDARASADSGPIGVVVTGQKGSGKTHLLSTVRERVQDTGGYFFLIGLLDASAFWRSALLSIMDGLTRQGPAGDSQLVVFLRRLADRVEAPRSVRRGITGDAPLNRATLDAFVDLLRKSDRQVGLDCQDTARALILRGCSIREAEDVGHTYLSSNDEEEPGERATWGIRRAKRAPQEIVRDLSRLLALTGPTVIAVDQIDGLIAQAAKSTGGRERATWSESILLEQIAGGLMSLREITRRTLSVVSCFPVSWELVKTQATDTVQDRFREATHLQQIGSAALAQALAERRFAPCFERVGFTPAYPSWPVLPSAFADAVDFTPRELLIAIDNHVRALLRDGEVRELPRLSASGKSPQIATTSTVKVPDEAMDSLDARFAELRDAADALTALDPASEDDIVPALLSAGLAAWMAEQGTAAAAYGQDPLPGPRPALHARLLRTVDDGSEEESHWAFRAICATHAIATLNRIRNAMTVSGLTEGVSRRRLFILRTPAWPHGQRTAEVTAAFEQAGGVKLDFAESDIKILVALQELQQTTEPEIFRGWCLDRRPTREVDFLQAALSHMEDLGAVEGRTPPEGDGVPRAVESTSDGPVIPLGESAFADPIGIRLKALRKHAAVFAGSGSGKTVFIRRLVEECALQGVSSIVLDLNNDLARLGDAWPQAPDTWRHGDAELAKEYLDTTDVVVWTPGRESGRPLSFRPLPDFGSVLDDKDEFNAAVEAALAALVPRARLDAKANKAQLGQAVLRQALAHYARGGGSDLKDFIALLDDLPDGVSVLQNARKMAGDMAQTLTAATVNDPLFGGDGEATDPAMLLSAPKGKRARISVVSFVGLPNPEQQQSFINQLQLALFSWIKRHPAGERPLGGLLVMDEAQNIAPSRGMTACTQSTLALASQARKYGLGLVFATQAPKGLHTGIPGNSATQLFGLLHSPAHIMAAREIARAKGSDVPDIARMKTGEFYAAIEGGAFDRIQSPMCLSHHPSSPLTVEEVIDRARR